MRAGEALTYEPAACWRRWQRSKEFFFEDRLPHPNLRSGRLGAHIRTSRFKWNRFRDEFRLSSARRCAIVGAMLPTQDLRVKETVRLSTPRALKAELPMTEASNQTVVAGRDMVTRILQRRDPRFLVVVGPCSIHDPKGALEYASKLNTLRQELSDQLWIVMRVYFEKPRTTIGWKGLINDPHLDGTYDIETGLKQARKLLLQIAEMGLPAATEFLDSIAPQYLADLVTWAAIGARTTESQTHREMASGLSMPVGFKNGTDGSLQTALDAMHASRTPHSFLGIDQDGITSIIRTSGNLVGHIVLRGGRLRTNYDAESLREAESRLTAAGLPAALMVDCSHANSGKQHARQEDVWRNLIDQRLAGNLGLIGAMVESNLFEGNQPIPRNLSELRYGVSITDSCLGWEATERMLRQGHAALARERTPEAVA
jgi:3-deoxy-7-phosphoheptulonate synthase